MANRFIIRPEIHIFFTLSSLESDAWVADSDNQDDEAGFVFLKDHPIGADAKSIKLFIRAMSLRMLFFNGA